MSGAQSISTRRAYGVQRVCRVWHCARSSVYARRQATPSPAPCRRRGPVGAAPDDVLVAHVRRVLEASPFHGEGYRKVWAKLRVEGRRTSKERVRRLMREHDLQAPQRAGHAHGPKAHDVKRPRFSWTRIKGESTVQGGGENGSVEGRGTGRGIGTDGGSPEGDWSPCRRRGGRGMAPWRRGSGGAPAGSATWCCGCCVANRWRRCPVRRAWRSTGSTRGGSGPWLASSSA